MKDRLRRLGQRWRWFGRALEVQDRVGEVDGGMVASAITVTVFVSLFPLLLVAIAVLGFVAAGDASVAGRVVEDLGLTGAAAETVRDAVARATESRQAASILGLAGLAWSGSAVAVALQQGVRAPWQARSNGLKDRALGLAWLAAASLLFVAAMGLGTLLNFLPDGVPAIVAAPLAIAVGLAVEVALFWWMFWGLGVRHVPPRDLLPGAVVGALGFEVLKLVGTVYVPRLLASSSSLYGPLGVVFAVLAWLALISKLVVYASAVNAVRFESRRGTVEVPIHVPRLPGQEPVAAKRGGAIVQAGEDPPAVPDPRPGTEAATRADEALGALHAAVEDRGRTVDDVATDSADHL